MKKWTFFLLLGFLYCSLSAQTPVLSWAHTFGEASGDFGQGLVTDPMGNVYLTGNFSGTVDFDPGTGVFELTAMGGNADIFVLKLTSSGDFVWAIAMGGAAYDAGRAIGIDDNGDLFITGRFGGTVDFDPGSGTTNLISNGLDDVFVCKYTEAGDLLWAGSFGSTSFEIGQDVVIDGGGNALLTGNFTGTVDFDPGPGVTNLTSTGDFDQFVVKWDGDGNLVWAKQLGGNSFDLGVTIDVDTLGNVYTAGHFSGTADFDPGTGMYELTSAGLQDIFVSKLDSNGDFEWAHRFGDTENDAAQAIQVGPSGNVYSVGYFEGTVDFDPGSSTHNLTSGVEVDVFISKLDDSGNFVWARQLAGTGFKDCVSVDIDVNQGVYTTGFFQDVMDFDPGMGTVSLTSNGAEDIYIHKLDADGNFDWVKQMGNMLGSGGIDLHLDAANNIYSTGYFQDTLDFNPDAGVLELVSNGNIDAYIHKMQNHLTATFDPVFAGTASLFPNPTHGPVYFGIEQMEQVKIQIHNAHGALLEVIEPLDLKGQFTIDGPSGLYLVDVIGKNGAKRFKVIKQ